MENELFMNAGLSHPPPEMTSPSSSSAMLNWVSMANQQVDPSISRNFSRDSFFWEKSTEQSIFDSALSSLVSSPTPSNSHFSGGGGVVGGDNNFVIRELIGKLGNIGNSSGDIYGTPASNGNFSGTPMSSPPPRSMMATKTTTPLAEFSGDPGFAERAARFSCFGSRSFNGRTNSPYPINNGPIGTTTVATNGKLTRVSSSPALKALTSQIPAGESSGEISRKRKAKAKENSPSTASPSKEEESDPKRSKKSEENGEKAKAVDDPHKDFIHVRARRGQATDSHSLAERVRREKISERMKLLQDLVPGCNKVTGKALMLDEIINYVQSLQRQVEFLSMKLSSVNTRLEFNMDTLVSKDIFLSSNNNSSMHQQILELESSVQTLLGDHLHNKTLQLTPNISSNNIMDPLDSISQYSAFSEDDLHSIVHMGFAQNHNQIQSHNFQGPSNQVPSSHMKAEH